jgi:hypothetical protein
VSQTPPSTSAQQPVYAPDHGASPTTHYVIGPPRSGTTILCYLLAGAQHTLSLSEPDLAREALPTWRLHRFYRRILAAGGCRPVRPPFSKDRGEYRRYLGTIAQRNGLTRLIIKETYRGTPISRRWSNESFLASVVGSQAGCAFVIRDPYDTCASFVRLARWVTGWTGRLIRLRWPDLPWFADADAAVRWSADNWRCYVEWLARQGEAAIRYEDIVASVEARLPELCHACRLPFDHEMLDFDRPRHAFGGLGDPGVMLKRPRAINATAVGRGRELTGAQLAMVRERCGSAAASLGYGDN